MIAGNIVEDLKVLVELQEVDSKIFEIETDLARKPRVLAFAAEALRACTAEVEAAQAVYDKAAGAKAALDSQLLAENDLIQKMKLRSPEIKTNKEYFLHIKEIEDGQKRIAGIEEKTLEFMDAIEKAEAVLNEKKAALKEEETIFAASKERIDTQFSSHDGSLAELKAKRGLLVPKISGETAYYYENIVKRYPESPVVEAMNGACTGCRMTLPPQVFNNVRKGESMIVCTQCARILFYKEPAKS